MTRDDLQLDVLWPDYFRQLAARNGEPCGSNGSVIILGRDNDNSYLGLLAACEAAFRSASRFEDIPPDQRKLIGGFGSGKSGWLGGLMGNGLGMQAINDKPEVIGSALDQIPFHRSADVTLEALDEYLTELMAIPGFHVASASRFLCTKRPDLFLGVNGANENNIRDYFGFSPRTKKGYLALHEKIWSYPWFNSPEPTESPEKNVWKNRVALLDAFFYDADER